MNTSAPQYGRHNAYVQGVLWSVAACFFSVLNDGLSKKLGGVYGINVLFFRFLFSALSLLPFMVVNPSWFWTKNMKIHALRGGLFAVAMMPWCYGLIALPLPLLTILSFTTPLFVVILAKLFLKETVGWRRWGATLVGFLGILVSVGFSLTGANGAVLWALLATGLFAVLDTVNKRLLSVDEPLLPMLFFSALWTTLFTAPLALLDWQWPSAMDWVPLVVLGLGANAMLGCILKSFSLCDVSSLQPIRYLEFVLSCAVSMVFFHKWPTMLDMLAMALIIPSTLYLAGHELNLWGILKSFGLRLYRPGKSKP